MVAVTGSLWELAVTPRWPEGPLFCPRTTVPSLEHLSHLPKRSHIHMPLVSVERKGPPVLGPPRGLHVVQSHLCVPADCMVEEMKQGAGRRNG